MNPVLPVLAAGATFAGCTLAGLALGAWLSQRTGAPLWVLGGLLGGIAAGGFAAARLFLRAMR
ncbi:MAG: AtpZ/AtpI family protein [Candidatus Eremiobacteraeota bacterium]|nr:AtpZ/AtpI family protein [Candidatus Eremiobacteraeota bacterium]